MNPNIRLSHVNPYSSLINVSIQSFASRIDHIPSDNQIKLYREGTKDNFEVLRELIIDNVKKILFKH